MKRFQESHPHSFYHFQQIEMRKIYTIHQKCEVYMTKEIVYNIIQKSMDLDTFNRQKNLWRKLKEEHHHVC